MTFGKWTAPPAWEVPREWVGERCFILCGGESVRAQRHLIPQLKGRFIAVKEGVLLRPDADVLFLGGEQTDSIARPLIPKFRGKYMVVRGKSLPSLPSTVLRVARTKDHTKFCDIPTHVCGYDSGTSSMDLAVKFGANEIVMIGYDMKGDRWFNGEYKHPQPHIPEDNHRGHLKPLVHLAADAERRGIKIWNASPISRATCFEFRKLESFL